MFFVRLKLKACKRNSNCILPISLQPNVAILNLAECIVSKVCTLHSVAKI